MYLVLTFRICKKCITDANLSRRGKMKILLLFGLVALSKGDTYVPGTPGAPWSPEVAATIR